MSGTSGCVGDARVTPMTRIRASGGAFYYRSRRELPVKLSALPLSGGRHGIRGFAARQRDCSHISTRDNAYGVTIRAELTDRAGRNVAPGALYTALERPPLAFPLERARDFRSGLAIGCELRARSNRGLHAADRRGQRVRRVDCGSGYCTRTGIEASTTPAAFVTSRCKSPAAAGTNSKS